MEVKLHRRIREITEKFTKSHGQNTDSSGKPFLCKHCVASGWSSFLHGRKMDVAELTALGTSKASDYEIEEEVGSGQNGLVVAARCHREGVPDPEKLYAVKLLFNFTHEYTSVVRNAFENEWLILSRLLPHENVVRFWAQFISAIPEGFAQLLPPETREHCTKKNRNGQIIATKGQFLVLDYHPSDLECWINKHHRPLQFDTLLNLTEQVLEGIQYLENNLIRHLDLKLSNVLVTEGEKIALCDFGCAVQYPDKAFTIPFIRGMLPGGNKAHLAPEVLNMHHKFKRNPNHSGLLDYSKQATFAAGVLIHEIATGDHPLSDYPLGHTVREYVTYSTDDVCALPTSYPNSFRSIVSDMVSYDPKKRLSIEEALNQLRVCCVKSKHRGSVTSQQTTIERVKRDRDLAKARVVCVRGSSIVDFAKIGGMNIPKITLYGKKQVPNMITLDYTVPMVLPRILMVGQSIHNIIRLLH